MYNDIILLMGMPRSGTSWLSQIFDSSPDVRFRLSPLFSYEFKNHLNVGSSREEWESVLRRAYASDNIFMSQTARRAAHIYPTFLNKAQEPSFLVIKDTRFHDVLTRTLQLFATLRMVAIVRHPCGAIHSWLTTPTEFPVTADRSKEWRTGHCRKMGPGEFWGFDDWKAVTRLHLALERDYPDRVIIQRYESLVANRVTETERLFAFCGLPFTPQTERFLDESRQRHESDPYAVFKHPGVAQRWRRELDPVIVGTILSELKDTELERFL